MSVDLEAARWRTDLGTDPRLVNSFATGQVQSAAALWHDGRLLIAALTGAHKDGDAEEAHDNFEAAVRIWDAGSGDLLRTIPDVGGADSAVTLAVVDGTPQILVADWTGPARRWDLQTGDSAEVAQPVQPVVDLLVDDMAGRPTLLLRGFRGNVEWWDLATATPTREPSAELLGYPHSLARLGGDLVTVTGRDGGRVEVRDVRTGEVRDGATVSAPAPFGLTIAGPYLVVARAGQVELVDLATGRPAPPLTDRTACASLAAVVVAGRPHLVTASTDAGRCGCGTSPPHRRRTVRLGTPT